MSGPKPEPGPEHGSELSPDSGQAALPAEEGARVREQIGEGLRKFYDSVLDEEIPAAWLNMVGSGETGDDE